MPSAKISALTALDSTANLAQLYIPLFKADGSPDNPRILASDLLLAADGVNITPAWSGTGTATTPLLVNVTADPGPANASSKLLDLQVVGVPTTYVTKAGVVSSLFFECRSVNLAGLYIKSDSNPSVVFGANSDLYVTRDAADRLALRRTTNAQRFSVYRTWTSSSNFERGVISWYDSASDDGTAGTVLRIGTEKGSLGGTARAVSLIVDGIERLGIDTSSNINFTGSFRNDTNAIALHSDGLRLGSAKQVGFSSTTSWVNTPDVALARSAANILGITNGSTGGGAIEFTEMTAPATPAANQARVFARDNGSGKTQVCIILPDGVVTVLATQT